MKKPKHGGKREGSDIPKLKKKGTWGGKRERKIKKEATKVMRIPVSKVNQVKALINEIKKVTL